VDIARTFWAVNDHLYLDSLPLAERLYRRDHSLAADIYSKQLLAYLRDGLIIVPGAIPVELLEAFDQDLDRLSDLDSAPPLLGSIEIDGPNKYYQARYLRNLGVKDFRLEPPGLKLVDLQRFLPSAEQLAFHPVITSFLSELFGSPAALIQSLTFWKGSEQSVHQDFSYVHHHRELAHLAAVWIPLEDIKADAGPLVYYPGSHRPDELGFFDWGGGSILASRDAPDSTFTAYGAHLEKQLRVHKRKSQIFLPRRGDILIWHGALVHGGTPMNNPDLTRKSYVCHYTSTASHKQLQKYRVGDAYCLDQQPQLPYRPSRVRRIINAMKNRIWPG